MNEFICDPDLLLQLIVKLEWATNMHRIFWASGSNKYYIKATSPLRHNVSLDKFAISFISGSTSDSVVIFVDKLYKTYTPIEDNVIFAAAKKLETAILESMTCVEAALTDMMDALSKM